MKKTIIIFLALFFVFASIAFAGVPEDLDNATLFVTPLNFSNATYGTLGGVPGIRVGAGYGAWDNYVLNSGIAFDGVGDYFDTEKTPNEIKFYEGGIITFWFNLTDDVGAFLFGALDGNPGVWVSRDGVNGLNFVVRDAGANQCLLQTSANVTVKDGNLQFVVWVYNATSTDTRLWVNDVEYTGANSGDCAGNVSLNRDIFLGDLDNAGAPANGWETGFAQFEFIGPSISPSATVRSYLRNSSFPRGSGAGPPPPPVAIVFSSQDPADITTLNVLNKSDGRVNITYQYANTTNLKQVYLNFTLNSTTSTRCGVIYNGVCVYSLGDYVTRLNQTSSGQLFSFFLTDEDIYPGTYNFNQSTIENTTHETFLMQGVNAGVKIELLNVSNSTPNNIFEVMIEKENTISTPATTYYCNSSYTTGQPALSDNCALFAVFTEDEFTHCHRFNTSCHIIKTFPINTTSGTFADVRISELSHFIIFSSSNDGWNVSYINLTNRTGNSETTANNGNTWNNLAGTIDGHIHQFESTDTLYYQACGNVSGVFSCSNFTSDTLDFDPLPPTPVTFIAPVEGQNATSTLLINYTASVVASGTPTYNISLYNPDFSFNRSIIENNTNALTYTWVIHFENLSLGQYRIGVQSKDTVNDVATTSFSDLWNLTTNALINITAIDAITSSNILIFSGWAFDLNTSRNESFSTSTNWTTVNSIRGNTYLIRVISGNYTSEIRTFVPDNLPIDNFSVSLYAFNSVRINILYALNSSAVFRNVTIKTISNLTSFEQWDNTGFVVIDFLFPNDYELRFEAAGLNSISKFLLVTNDSTQNITVYMTLNTTITLQEIEVVDTANQPVEGAVVWLQKEIIGDPDLFLTVQEAITNSEGKTAVWVLRDVTIFYRFAVIVDGVAVPIEPNQNIFTTKTFFIPGVTETIRLIINLEGEGFEIITERLAVVTDLNVVNNSFVYDFIDGGSSIVGGRLKVYGKFLNSSLVYEFISEQTILGSFGQINYTPPAINNTIFRGVAVIVYQTTEEIVDEKFIIFEMPAAPPKYLGLLISILIFMVVALLSVSFGLLTSSIFAILSLTLGSIFVFSSIPQVLINSLICLSIILFVKVRKK